MITSEVDLSLSALAIKNHPCRRLFFAAALLIACTLHGQTAAGGENTWLDENQVHQAMHEEAFRLLVLKIDSVRNEAAGGFDYHIEQAYEKIKKRLPSDPLSASELEAWLQQFLQTPGAVDSDSEFQTLINHFILGMTLEIINTLQFECEGAEDLIAQVVKLEGEINKTHHPDRETLYRALRQSGLSKKMYRLMKAIDRGWRIPPADSDNFSVFSVLKKNMTGQSADRDLRLVFDLGDRYHSRYPFLDGFMENYRCLAETFRQAVFNLNALLNDSSDPDSEALD